MRFRTWIAGVAASAVLGGVLSTLIAADAPIERRQVSDEELEELLRNSPHDEDALHLVLVPTSVEDRRGRTVRGLTRRDFRVLENQVPQQIAFFDQEADEPISIAFMLDLSGSMRQVGKLENAKEAIRFFIDSLRPRDRFGLVGFADEQVVWITPFTADRPTFLERLQVQEGYGQTALHDAVAAAPTLVNQADAGRKAIVLFTDGVDNRSSMSIGQAIAHARKVHVPIYTIGFTSLPEMVRKKRSGQALDVLERFSNETGGALYVVSDPDELKEAISEIAEDLRFQYVLGYYPTHARWDGSFRRIQVETDRGNLVVRARNGYYARR